MRQWLSQLRRMQDIVPRVFQVTSSYSLVLGSGGCVSPNKPKAFVYRMVIFTIEAPQDAIEGGRGRAM